MDLSLGHDVDKVLHHQQQNVAIESVAAITQPFCNNTPAATQGLNNLQATASSDPNSNLNSAPSGTTYCQHRQTPPAVHWINGSDKLVHDVQICPNHIARFGNGFARMRRAEEGLQASTGIQIRHGGAVAGSPNNALGELRLLVSNANCEYRQLIVSFVDLHGRHLLYRSTGGRVMEYVTDDTGERKKQVKTVFHDKTYAYTGAFSFCPSGSKDAEASWARYHDGDYMRGMLVSGKAGEHFHHSEQSYYRLLFDYADRLPGVIRKALDETQNAFRQVGPITLHVLSVDIFTTRAACANCSSSSLVLLEDQRHFFAKFTSAIGNTFNRAAEIRNLVRIDCAVRHNNTPTIATTEAMPAALKVTVHAMPLTANAASLSNMDGDHCVHLYLSVPVNQAEFILQAGGDKRHWTKIELYIEQLKTLGNAITEFTQISAEMIAKLSLLIKGEPAKGLFPKVKPQPETFLLIALEITKRLEGNKKLQKRKAHLAVLTPSSTMTAVQHRVFQLVQCGFEAGLPLKNTLDMMIRHYRQIGLATLITAQVDIETALRVAATSGIDHLTGLRLFSEFLESDFSKELFTVKVHVVSEIRELCRSNDTGDKEDAAALAQDFDLIQEYRDAGQDNSGRILGGQNNSSSSSSQQGGAPSTLTDEI